MEDYDKNRFEIARYKMKINGYGSRGIKDVNLNFTNYYSRHTIKKHHIWMVGIHNFDPIKILEARDFHRRFNTQEELMAFNIWVREQVSTYFDLAPIIKDLVDCLDVGSFNARTFSGNCTKCGCENVLIMSVGMDGRICRDCYEKKEQRTRLNKEVLLITKRLQELNDLIIEEKRTKDVMFEECELCDNRQKQLNEAYIWYKERVTRICDDCFIKTKEIVEERGSIT